MHVGRERPCRKPLHFCCATASSGRGDTAKILQVGRARGGGVVCSYPSWWTCFTFCIKSPSTLALGCCSVIRLACPCAHQSWETLATQPAFSAVLATCAMLCAGAYLVLVWARLLLLLPSVFATNIGRRTIQSGLALGVDMPHRCDGDLIPCRVFRLPFAVVTLYYFTAIIAALISATNI